jgi:hypothetical protein
MTTAAISTFEPHNLTLGAGEHGTVEVISGDKVGGFAKRFSSADSFVVSVIGNSGLYASIRIDSDTSELLRIPSGQVIQIFAPVANRIYVSNESSGSVIVSIAFIRGRNHY